jgi:hypothetical protein
MTFKLWVPSIDTPYSRHRQTTLSWSGHFVYALEHVVCGRNIYDSTVGIVITVLGGRKGSHGAFVAAFLHVAAPTMGC